MIWLGGNLLMEKVPMIFDFDCPPSVYGTGLIVGFGTGLPRSLDTQMSIFYRFILAFQIGLFTRILRKTQSPSVLIRDKHREKPGTRISTTARPPSTTCLFDCV